MNRRTMIPKEIVLTGDEYATQRARWQERMIRLKKPRRLSLGPHIDVLFECWHTVLYQIQETIHIENIKSQRRIQQLVNELAPLLPSENAIPVSMLVYGGSPNERQALDDAIDHGRLTLTIGDTTVAAIPLSSEDRTGPVRYLSFALPNGEKLAAVEERSPGMLSLSMPPWRYRQSVPVSLIEALADDVGVFFKSARKQPINQRSRPALRVASF